MRFFIYNKTVNPLIKYIIGGIIFVLMFYLVYILFAIAIWGALLGIIIYMIISIKNYFSKKKPSKRNPITILNCTIIKAKIGFFVQVFWIKRSN